MVTTEQLVKQVFGEDCDYQDIMSKLEYSMGERMESALGRTVECEGKKVNVPRINRTTMKKIQSLYIKAKKDSEGNLVDNKHNRLLDVKASSLILLDGFFGVKQKLFHWLHWRWMANNSKYSTYLFNGIISKATNDIEQVFFCNNLEYLKLTAMQRMKARQQK